MDKNVGNVDIDELKRAREELDRERGVETDPNMYSNYNPNRESEESQAVITETSDDMFENSQKLEEEMLNVEDLATNDLARMAESLAAPVIEESTAETSISGEEIAPISNESISDSLEENLANPSEAQLAENEIPAPAGELPESVNVEPVTIIEQKDEPVQTEMSAEQKQIMEETSGEVDFSVYDSFADFEVEANKNIIAEEKPQSAETLESAEVTTAETANDGEDFVAQDVATEEITAEDVNDAVEMIEFLSNEISSAESENADETPLVEKESVETAVQNEEVDSGEEDDSAETVNMENSISVLEEAANKEETEDTDESDDSVQETDEVDGEDDAQPAKSNDADEISKLEAQIAELKAKLKESEEDEQEQIEDDKQTEENYASDAEDDYDAINSLMDSLEGLKPIDLTEDEKREIDEKRREAEERKKDEELQIIDDFRKLERLDRILSEDMEEEQPQANEVVAPKITYPEIEEVDFVDIISTEEFKSTDNLSYVLGKDELGKVHYGNLRDFYNMVIYSKDNNSALSAVHSVLVSLILKNSTNDINFVICDSKADSKLQVYNKSSYMYFNRLAKTNKEILDTLIEISKELEERYKILAAAGVKSIEQYNVIAKNDNLKQLPYIVTVFNNYTKSMQLAESDKINTILYQILKLGRIVGLYLIVVGNMKIKSDDINYNLPTRLSFVMSDEDDSLSMLGVGGAEALETNDEFLLSSLDSQTPVHLKVPNISVKELEVLIKNIEN